MAAETPVEPADGALTEISLTIANADDPARARAQAGRLVHSMLAGLAT